MGTNPQASVLELVLYEHAIDGTMVGGYTVYGLRADRVPLKVCKTREIYITPPRARQ